MNAIILSVIWGMVMMLSAIFIKSKRVPQILAVIGICVLLISNLIEFFAGPFIQLNVHDLLSFKSYALLINTVAFVCTLFLFLLNGKDFEKSGNHVSEYFSLIFFSLCGISICSSYNSLWMLFAGLELMTIPLYILTGIDKTNLKGNEASLKYFFMGIFISALLLLGITLIYGGNSLGSFSINLIDTGLGHIPILIGVGMVLLIVALSFHISAVPFHFWAPDVIDGAPMSVASFIASVARIGAFAAFLRLFEGSFIQVHLQWQFLIAILITATLLIGNISAIFQRSVKRMLAYSGIGQAGFMLFSIFAVNGTGNEGLLIYAAAYGLATIGMFGVISKMPDYTLDGFKGLGKSHPAVAFTVTIFLLSLTGIPLTAGFMAKAYLLLAAIRDGHQFWLVIVAALCVVVSSIYY